MEMVIRAEDVIDDTVATFPGLIAAFLYCDLDAGFRGFLQTHWASLNNLSNTELLVLVPKQKKTTKQKRRISDLVRSFPHVTRRSWERSAVAISDHFGIRLSQFPCIVFFDHPQSNEVYCFRFLDDDSANALARDLKGIFEICRDVVKTNGPARNLDDQEALRIWRAEMLDQLAPELRKMKALRFFKRMALSRAVSNVLGIGRSLSLG